MRPSHDELKSLWIYSYSRASLLEAQQWLDSMDHTDPKSPQFRALVCASVVAYARPFMISQVTQKERVVPLKGVLPPSPLNATHAMVLKLRDKVMGHKDATPAKGDSTTPNIMLIRRDATGFDLHTIIIEGMELETRTEVKALCSHFVAHCEAQVHPIIARYGSEIMRHPVGTYELLVTEPPHDWIRVHK
jgi:hypothetical protein